MRVVVLMSTYNGEGFVKKQIESILKQKRTYYGEDNIEYSFDVELHIRDDGSSDNTRGILEEYEKNNLIKCYYEKNRGSSNSFFDLIIHSEKFDYYALSDQDDYWEEEKLSKAIEMLEKYKRTSNTDSLLVYGSNAKLVDRNLKPMGRNFYPCPMYTDMNTISCSCGFLGCTMVFNDALVRYIKKYSIPQHAVMHDFYITLLCIVLGGKAIYDDNAYIQYRQHDGNVCGASVTTKRKLLSHIKALSKKPNISIDEQAMEILTNYNDCILPDKQEWLKRVSEYQSSFLSSISLALSRKIRFYNISRSMAMRLRLACRTL